MSEPEKQDTAARAQQPRHTALQWVMPPGEMHMPITSAKEILDYLADRTADSNPRPAITRMSYNGRELEIVLTDPAA